MNNVKTLDDVNDNRKNMKRPQNHPRSNSSLIRNSETQHLMAAQENFNSSPFKAILMFMFPHFTVFSATFIYFLVCWIMYGVQCYLYTKYNWNWVLYMLGAKYLPVIQSDLEIYRFILPIFLHLDIWHLLFNMLALLMIGMQTEHYSVLTMQPRGKCIDRCVLL